MNVPNPKDTTPITVPQRSRRDWAAQIAADAAARRTEQRAREMSRNTTTQQPSAPPTP